MKLNFTPFPILVTERLILRQLDEADKGNIFLLRSDEKVNKYLERTGQKNITEANEFISKINEGISRNKWIYWAISLKENHELIGTICLWNFSNKNTTAEIGYELIPEFHGKGIMNEALRKIIDFGFEKINLRKIYAYTHKENAASIRLLNKNNFVLNKKPEDSENGNHIIFELTHDG